jgi:esterase/lipase superfamily enzyme
MVAKQTSFCVLLCVLASASGCHRYLAATPNVLQQNPSNAAKDDGAPPVTVLYATDRASADPHAKLPAFGIARSTELVFGSAEVKLNAVTSWTQLVNEGEAREYELQLAHVERAGQLDSRREPGATILQAAHSETSQLHELLRKRLAQTVRKDVFIFVHGFNNSFDDAVFRAAEIWHYMGRVGVPVAYSWPAGLGGLRGYPYDRESGEFTVSHLRQFIKAVAACPEVQRIHLIAHSRGCDVAMSALRELNLENSARGTPTQQMLKLENLVLAAPDLDEDVFLQRYVGEGVLQCARRTTVYVSPTDKAIELSGAVFASRRLGALDGKELGPRLTQIPSVHFIECKVGGLAHTHSYAFTDPAALSDLILVLRDGRDPGVVNGRPLRQRASGVWELNDDYLKASK